MSKDELSPKALESKLQQWKTNFDMIQGKANGILGGGANLMLQNCANEIMTLVSENQRLKKQLDEALKLIPKPKELPKSEMPPKKP